MLNATTIDKISKTIRQVIDPERIILFGSYAYGKPKENSDLDLLVLKNGMQNRRQELVNLKKQLISKDYSLDILLYSEEEYARKKNEGWQVFMDIEAKGKPL